MYRCLNCNWAGKQLIYWKPDYYCCSCHSKNVTVDIDQLTDNEKIVLVYTYRYKNTYNGRKNIRFVNANSATGITEQQWINAQKLLASNGLLRPHNNSLTEITKRFLHDNWSLFVKEYPYR